jgi:flavin-dependent dehydrogenase
MTKQWDIIVVGGNVAGASMAKGLAENGLKVLLVERMPQIKIGSNTCGDGLDKQEFKRLGLDLPEGDFVDGDIFHAVAYAPDRIHTLSAGGVLRAVHRYKFCQYLINLAASAGVEISDNTHAVGPLIKKDHVAGIRIKKSDGTDEKLMSKMVVDASGINGVIRRRLPQDWWVTEKINSMDTSVCFKETRIFPKPQPEPSVRGYLTRDIAPGGYYWVAMRTKTKVNVGMGVKRTGSHPNPRKQIYKKCFRCTRSFRKPRSSGMAAE